MRFLQQVALGTRAALLAIACCSLAAQPALAARGGQLHLKIVDRDSKKPLVCRMHLSTAKGKPVLPPGIPSIADYLLIDGEATLRLPLGTYQFDVEHGPEYLVRHGQFTIGDDADDSQVVDLKRIADLSAEGWWSGDLDVEAITGFFPLALRADDLHVAEVVIASNAKSLGAPRRSPGVRKPPARPRQPQPGAAWEIAPGHFVRISAVGDFREGGAVLIAGLQKPLKLPAARAAEPSTTALLAEAQLLGRCWIDVVNPASLDLPIWLASGQVDSIELASSRLLRRGYSPLVGGRPFDRTMYPGKEGPAKWDEAIYYQLLNCGLQIPPTAGSGSGRNSNPVGYNRVYAKLDGPLTHEKWWDAVRAGRVVVTNGPLLRPSVEGHPPGHVFKADKGQRVELEIALTLSTQQHVEYLEVIQNGRLAHEVRLEAWSKAGGRLPKLVFDKSGWFLVRAITDAHETFRFASSGPYYVKIGYDNHVSKAAASQMLAWTEERIAELKLPKAKVPGANEANDREAKEPDSKASDKTPETYRWARKFWQDRVEHATAP